MEEPFGYIEKQFIPELKVSNRFALTFAAAENLRKAGNPTIFSILNDETTGNTGVYYFYDGTSDNSALVPFGGAVSGSTHQRVASYADMISQLVAGRNQRFTVIDDEVQGIQSVLYEWDGVELFVYGTLVEPQPVVV